MYRQSLNEGSRVGGWVSTGGGEDPKALIGVQLAVAEY